MSASGSTRRESAALFARGSAVLVGAVSSSAREPRSGAAPVFLDHGRDGRVVDVDGREYVDLVMANGSLIHGHAQEDLREAMSAAMGRMSHGSIASRAEVELAELLCGHIPSAERVRFFSSGTEAVMASLRIARTATGRSKVVKFEGNYHGWADGMSVSSNAATSRELGDRRSPVPVPDTSGLPAAHLAETIVVPWNDLALLEEVLAAHRDEIAAVICEPFLGNIGLLVPDPGYLEGVRRATAEAGVLMILDETHSGMRHAPGTAQQAHGIAPDLTTLGKALGAGFPVAAVLGRADVMSVLHHGRAMPGGTHNGNIALLSVAQASAHRSLADDARALRELDARTSALVARLREAASRSRTRRILVQGAGSAFQLHVLRQGAQADVISDARQCGDLVDLAAYDLLAERMREHGVLLVPSGSLHCVLATSHSDADLDQVVDGLVAALDDLAAHPLW